ncbi:MAG: hypothetical protein ACRDHN_09560 [Thermomicrobiales bacterium]
MEVHTISWLPSNLKVRVNALLPECGHNFTLHETIEYALANDERVSLWGAFRIQPELFERALRRKAELERGHIKYKADDFGYRSNRVTNCIHAVSSIIEGPKLRVASPGWGESASFYVLQEMQPWIRSKCPEWDLTYALGLEQYPLIYREWRNPFSNAAIGTVNRIVGGERNLQATYGPPDR